MPCTDGGVPYPDDTKERLDKVTRLLCELCARIEKGNTGFSAELSAWWNEHKAADAKQALFEAETKRIKKLRKDALEKLSPEERRILGVK